MKTAIQIALVVVATAFALNAMSQVGQPWQPEYEESRLPRLFSTDSPAGTWKHSDDLRDKQVNRGIASAVVIAVYLPSAIVLGPLSVVDFFVTKRKIRKNASLTSK